ncbi:hypothetical protein GCM10027277_27140 [Pseudoduganella ginsengisoli]|uniref:Pilus assembly protein n=1 Tax=Pseudoduganella ginsengisoli TaxID=1462440 RepID=A0A6L6Q217_9BURK|nr:hypothetical protein [Pseudoduganella ginsengisoli]MTW03479.1 hypothetical protein [Pseudoduganella ginsengisoli]
MMTMPKRLSYWLRYALPCLLSACASPPALQTPPASGDVVRAAFARQVIALPSNAPVTGIDSGAALQAQQAYRKSYAEKEPAYRPLVIGAGAQK